MKSPQLKGRSNLWIWRRASGERAGQELWTEVRKADGFWDRLVGLMGRSTLGQQSGMWFPRCQSVHMWWMRLNLDLIFLREREMGKYQVVRLVRNARPWAPLPFWCATATDVLEVSEGAVDRLQLSVGEEVACFSSA